MTWRNIKALWRFKWTTHKREEVKQSEENMLACFHFRKHIYSSFISLPFSKILTWNGSKVTITILTSWLFICQVETTFSFQRPRPWKDQNSLWRISTFNITWVLRSIKYKMFKVSFETLAPNLNIYGVSDRVGRLLFTTITLIIRWKWLTNLDSKGTKRSLFQTAADLLKVTLKIILLYVNGGWKICSLE